MEREKQKMLFTSIFSFYSNDLELFKIEKRDGREFSERVGNTSNFSQCFQKTCRAVM